MIIEVGEKQVVLAIRPTEVASVAKAVSEKQSVFCVARSASAKPVVRANQSETASELASDPNPLSEITITETLIGGKRQAAAYRRNP